MTTNPSYLDKQHPVRVILEQAALGQRPTKAHLDKLLDRPDLPDGHDLSRFRTKVVKAADAIADTYGGNGSNEHGAARRQADDLVADLAASMTDPERAITSTHAPSADTDPDDVRALAERMFRR